LDERSGGKTPHPSSTDGSKSNIASSTSNMDRGGSVPSTSHWSFSQEGFLQHFKDLEVGAWIGPKMKINHRNKAEPGVFASEEFKRLRMVGIPLTSVPKSL
jgi:hypothetical protein